MEQKSGKMARKYSVQWTASAQEDLKQVVDYLAQEDPSLALRILERIKGKAADLYAFPDRGRVVPELKLHGSSLYREIILLPWRIIYRIADSTVYVTAVLDSRRNIEDVLLERLIRRRLSG